MPFIEDLGQQAAGGLLGTGMGLLLQRHNDNRQYNQQERLQGLQIRGNQQMMDYAYKKQMEMWNATNYAAQLQHMKAAGLSPGLMYGMKGGGGVTVGQPTGAVQGAGAPVGGNEIPSMLGMGLQLQLLKAQKENIEADTLKKKTDAAKTAGVDTELTKTQTESLSQGIQNQKAQQRLTTLEADLQEVKNEIAKATKDQAIQIIDNEMHRGIQEIDRLVRHNFIDEKTKWDKIGIVKADLAKTWAEKYLIDAQTTTEKGKPAVQAAEIALMAEQVWALTRQGAQRWRELEIQGGNMDTNRQALEEQMFKNSNLPPDLVQTILGIIIGRAGATPTTKPVTGFHDR